MDETPFDDIDALNALASDDFGDWTGELVVTQDLIDAFADLTHDRQWIHVDVERARDESPYGTTIAHGFLTLSLLHRLGAYPLRVSGAASATNYGADSLRFISPVPAGSTIRGRGRVVRAEPRGNGTLVTSEIEARVDGADKPSVLYQMQVFYR
jgi:acyl dehydratase